MERFITVGKNTMHVEVRGQGTPIVMLPGLGDPSPCMDMRPLAEKLQDDFTVVILEPAGYGLSEPAQTPRTIQNITDDISGVMHVLGFERYVIIAHSISGLYALYLLKHKRSEVSGFVALDISVPWQFSSEFAEQELTMMAEQRRNGLNNFDEEYAKKLKEQYLGLIKGTTDYPYTQEDFMHYENIIIRNAHDPSAIDELERTNANAEEVQNVKIPDDCPSLMLIARENTKRLAEWEGWHREICGKNTIIRMMECDHYIHLMKTAETAALIKNLFCS